MSQAALAPKTCPTCGSTFEVDAAFCPTDGTRLLPHGDPPAPERDPRIGMTVAGDVEIRSVAGAGAMGRVYRAHQRGIDRDVAVKVLHRELSGNPQVAQRFHREAKIASKLQHPHVVEVFLTGQLPDGSLFIVMEFLEGMSLAAALDATGGAFGRDRVLPIALQICDAVGEGHARGIVHRDLKPENVMLVKRADHDDWVKVLDFGIAKVSLGEQSMETAAGLIFGTARYISPEGAAGTTVGPQGDVYSLATMVYQMFAARTPFDAETPVGLLVKHIHEKPPELRSWPRAKDVPEAIAKVIMDNLAKGPEARAPNARAFGSALAAAAKSAHMAIADVSVLSRLSAPSPAPAPAPVPALAPTQAIEPTLDDAAEQRAPDPPIPPRAALAPAPVDEADRDHGDQPSSRRRPRARSWPVVVLAFLLGAAIAALVVQYVLNRRDPVYDAQLAKCRRALTENRYVTPPDDNVRDLVAAGLAKWPDDVRLLQIRGEAAHEMVTRAMAAHSGGDVEGARDLAKDALTLDTTDYAAKILADQYADEARSLETDAGATTGNARILFATPARAKPGDSFEVTGRILPRGAGPKARVGPVNMAIYQKGKVLEAKTLTVAESGQLVYKARVVAPGPGAYDLVFEASVEGRLLRAERDLDVAPP